MAIAARTATMPKAHVASPRSFELLVMDKKSLSSVLFVMFVVFPLVVDGAGVVLFDGAGVVLFDGAGVVHFDGAGVGDFDGAGVGDFEGAGVGDFEGAGVPETPDTPETSPVNILTVAAHTCDLSSCVVVHGLVSGLPRM